MHIVISVENEETVVLQSNYQLFILSELYSVK